MRKTLLATTALLAALLLLAAPLANATWGHSFTYTKFNTTTMTYQEIDEARTDWQVRITNKLVYNATTGQAAQIRLTNSTSANNQTIINLNHDSTKTVKVYVGDSSGTSLIVIVSHSADETIYYTCKDGYLDIGNKTHLDAYLADYILGNFTLAYVGAAGKAADVATSGYIAVEVSDAPVSIALESTLDIIIAVVPIIFTVAVLGVVIKMFKEVSG